MHNVKNYGNTKDEIDKDKIKTVTGLIINLKIRIWILFWQIPLRVLINLFQKIH